LYAISSVVLEEVLQPLLGSSQSPGGQSIAFIATAFNPLKMEAEKKLFHCKLKPTPRKLNNKFFAVAVVCTNNKS